MYFCMNSAIDDFVDIVKRNRNKFTNGVVHSFQGSKQEVKRLIDLDLYIGLSGDSFKNDR